MKFAYSNSSSSFMGAHPTTAVTFNEAMHLYFDALSVRKRVPILMFLWQDERELTPLLEKHFKCSFSKANYPDWVRQGIIVHQNYRLVVQVAARNSGAYFKMGLSY